MNYNYLKFSFPVVMLILSLTACNATGGVNPGNESLEATARKYVESSSFFPNPERGWHIPLDPIFTTNETAPPLTLEQVRGYRHEGKTLVRKYYLLYNYKNGPIEQSYLDEQLIHDLAIAREGGIKLIPRFAYTWNIGFAPGAGDDAPVERILEHLDQLAPILENNVDVISHMEMGFVGQYAEWHDSSNGNVNGDLTLNEKSEQIINKVFEVLPEERMALIRYPKQVIQLYPTPLTADEAYTGSNQSRLGLHDDGWLRDETFFGTYPADSDERQVQRDYQEQLTQYVVMSGEPASLNASEYGLKVDPIAELEKMHWTSLRDEPEGFGQPYTLWRETGAYDEMSKRLGYRLSLANVQISKNVSPAKSLRVTLGLKNSGFASLHNRRLLEVVLRNTATGEEYFATLSDDPRRWLPGETAQVAAEVSLPSDIVPGEYAVFLNLPDPAPSLYGRPKFSIRLANDGVWEDYSGYNALGMTVTVRGGTSNTASGNGLTFQKRTELPQSPAAEPAITLTARPVPAQPATPPTLKAGDVLVDFQDRSTRPRSLRGMYGGIDWGRQGRVRTRGDASGIYLYAADNSFSFTLPLGKVLKSISLLKLNGQGIANEMVLSSEGNPDFRWSNPARWWSNHELGWNTPAQQVTITLTSEARRGALVLDTLVYGDPPPPDTLVDFEDLTVGQTLIGIYNGIDFGGAGSWTVGESDGNKYIYLNSSATTLEATLTLPAGAILKSAGMRKLQGEPYGPDSRIFLSDANGSGAVWAFEVAFFNNGYTTEWSVPTGQLRVRVESTFGASNVLIGQLLFGY
jgi:Domain of unknown function (DUF4832)/Domain of unknown function (DUF4874)